jgi:hypothetical protein
MVCVNERMSILVTTMSARLLTVSRKGYDEVNASVEESRGIV